MTQVSLIPLRFGPGRGAMPPLGCLLLAASLRDHDIESEVIDTGPMHDLGPFSIDRFAEVVESSSGDIVALSIFNDAVPLLIATMREYPNLTRGRRLLLGGPGVTGLERELLDALPCVEAIVRGDGETAIVDLVTNRRRPLLLPAGRFERDHRGIALGAGSSERQDMAHIPAPAWEMLDPAAGYQQIPISSMRGCPFDCSFCDVIASFGRRVSRRPRDLVEQDIRSGVRHFGVRAIRMVDDTFNVSRPHMVEICEALQAAGEGLAFTAYARMEMLTRADVQLLSEAGARRLFLGVDAVDAGSHRPLSKGYAESSVRDVLLMVADHVGVSMSMIFGFPGETWKVFERGLELASELLETCPNENIWPQYSLLSPSVATPLYPEYADSMILDPDSPQFVLASSLSSARGSPSAAPGFDAVVEVMREYPRLSAPFWRYPTPDFEKKCDAVEGLRARVEERVGAAVRDWASKKEEVLYVS